MDRSQRVATQTLKAPTPKTRARCIVPLLRWSQREEILGAFYGILEAAEELLEVGAAFYEVDVGGVDDQEIGGGVAEEEMFVGAGDFLDVLEGDLRFFAGGFFGDARAQHFRIGLEVDDQIGRGDFRSEGFVVALVELELFVIEIEVGEDAILFHEEIGDDRAGGFDGEGFAEAALALHQEIHLRAQRGAGLFFVEVGEEGVVLAVVDAAGMQALGEDFGEGAFADAQRAFDDDEAGSLRSSLRGEGALGGGGFVGRHALMRGIIAKGRSWRLEVGGWKKPKGLTPKRVSYTGIFDEGKGMPGKRKFLPWAA